ncbi:GNAT family N-acetyltransferase [Tropicimonas isoalkanivorans]|uniref:Acetyltransferase (GNAT) family protein n=1 Tax=Tropicimonas isoalkanivorans TaxID=441112 RepID=A0A1I1P6M0_9RHOB|nr:GNAT family N-acetyltransferase [Tropicimonas isoalkanivorans]SFD01630.1 Acetyltransferase (GNAT) family protein [Tropicimonas isoalkanivorans]
MPCGADSHTYRRYSEALYDALREDPFYATLERRAPDPETSRDTMLAYYDHSILEAETYGRLVLPQDGTFGASVWSVPLDSARARQKSLCKHEAIGREMGEACLQAYETMCDFMADATGPLVSERDWYLSIVGLRPKFQGQGRGADLIRPVLEDADRASVATYLETFTPANMSFYARLGYEASGCFREPLTDRDYWVMRRQPRADG